MKIRITFLAIFLASTSAMAAPHVHISARATPREMFAEQRLQLAVRGLPGDEQILLATRLDPLLKPYDKQIADFWPVGHAVPEPPIVVRAHATDIDDVMAQAKPLYGNIDTMFKWNGESLTWTNVRGPVRAEFERWWLARMCRSRISICCRTWSRFGGVIRTSFARRF
jgi:hypothetical protein